jgi:3-oxoacyl-[acyl-carrier-protein] synthase-3
VSAVTHLLPPRSVSNQEIITEHKLRLKDAWVRQNIGIESRHWCAPGTPTSELAADVCRSLVQMAGIAAEDVSRLLVATVSPDLLTPSTACITQSLFAPGATFPCVDLVGACGGFLYALDLGRRCVQTGDDRVLCVAAEIRSHFLDKQDRRTVMLFGDGAGGVLLERCLPGEVGIIATETFADGRFWSAVCVPGSGTRAVVREGETVPAGPTILMQDGALVFERAVTEMTALVTRVVEKQRLTAADVDFFVFHQASSAIVRRVCEALAIPLEKTHMNFHRVGNTTAASVPIVLSESVAERKIAPGDLVCVVATGGGFTAGVALLRWERSGTERP